MLSHILLHLRTLSVNLSLPQTPVATTHTTTRRKTRSVQVTRAQQLPKVSLRPGAPQRDDSLGGLRRDQLELIAPSCSLHVNSSIEPHVISGNRHKDRRRWRPLERSPALGRHGHCRRDLVVRACHSHGRRSQGPNKSRSCQYDTQER